MNSGDDHMNDEDHDNDYKVANAEHTKTWWEKNLPKLASLPPDGGWVGGPEGRTERDELLLEYLTELNCNYCSNGLFDTCSAADFLIGLEDLNGAELQETIAAWLPSTCDYCEAKHEKARNE